MPDRSIGNVKPLTPVQHEALQQAALYQMEQELTPEEEHRKDVDTMALLVASMRQVEEACLRTALGLSGQSQRISLALFHANQDLTEAREKLEERLKQEVLKLADPSVVGE